MSIINKTEQIISSSSIYKKLNKNKFLIKYFLLYWKYIRWFLFKPQKPKLFEKNIHLGCGSIDYPGFINIDKMPYRHIHYLSGVEELPMLKDDRIDLIYISHCLEHIPFKKIPNVLKEYFRILKQGGILRISVPNFDTINEMYNDIPDLDTLNEVIYGSQDYNCNFHYTGFNEPYLTQLLKRAGFNQIRKWKHGEEAYKDLPDWSGKAVRLKGKEYFISLNLEAIK